MKKLMLLAMLVLFFVSCAKETVLSVFEDEIGKPISVEKFGLNETQYHWSGISSLKQTVLKNSLDKTIGALPIKESGIESRKYSDNKYRGYEYFVWETTEIKVELDCNYSEDMEKMSVRLIVVPK